MATQPTNPPVVSSFAGYPTRSDAPSEAAYIAAVETADSQIGPFTDEINAAAANVYANTVTSYNNSNEIFGKAEEAEASAIAAAASQAIVEAAANFKGEWSGLSGALNKPATVYHSGYFWQLLNNLADIAASEPTVNNADWVISAAYDYTPDSNPTIDLDFAVGSYKIDDGSELLSTTDPESILTVTRASTKWVEGADGYLREVPADTVAREWRNGVPNGVLLEEQRTNLILHSADLSNPAWNTTTQEVITSSQTAPIKTETMQVMYPTGSQPRKGFPVNFVSGTTYTYSIYAKKKEFRYISIFMGNDTLDSRGSFYGSTRAFDLENGLLVSLVNKQISPLEGFESKYLGRGIYKLIYTFTAANTILEAVDMTVLSDADISVNSVTPNGTDGVYLWGAQMEVGSAPSSYIPTTVSTVTRVSDSVSRLMGIEFNKNEGSIYAEYNNDNLDYTSSKVITSLVNTLSGEGLFLYKNNTGGSSHNYLQVFDGVSSFFLTFNSPIDGKVKIMATWDEDGNYNVCVNGVFKTGVFTALSSIDVDALRFFRGSTILDDAVGAVRVFPKALSTAEISAMTRL